MVPGATNVNLAVLIGTQLRGVRGAWRRSPDCCWRHLSILLSWVACISRPTMCPAADGSTPRWLAPAPPRSGSTSPPASGSAHHIRRVGPVLVAAAIIVGIGILRIPLLEVLIVMLPASLGLTLFERGR